MYYAQLRYWNDHPRVDQIAAVYFKIKPRKTPKPRRDGKPARPIQWDLMDAPLTDAERGAVTGARPIKAGERWLGI